MTTNKTTRKYVSNIITEQEISKWENSLIAVHYGTGTGKTKWVNNTLYPYTLSKGSNLLYISPRTLITKQTKQENQFGVEYMNIQKVTSDYLNSDIDHFNNFDYIVIDEYHSMAYDIEFNQNMIHLYDLINKHRNQRNIILVSATPLLKVFEFDYEYKSLESMNMSHRINTIDSFDSDGNLYNKLDDIINNTNDKVFIYINDSKKIIEIMNKYKDITTIYGSKSNQMLSNFYNEEEEAAIINDEMFHSRILISTKAIDSGVSLRDEELKHILIWEWDVSQIYQVISRKRMINKNDKVDVYLRNYNKYELKGIQSNITKLDNQLDIYYNQPEQFVKQQISGKIDNTLFISRIKDGGYTIEVNPLRKYKLNHDKFIMEKTQRDGFLNVVQQGLCVSVVDRSKLDYQTQINITLKENIGNKMFKEQQEMFKEFLKSVMYKNRYYGLKSINQFLEDNKVDYRIESDREWSRESVNRGKTYWYIVAV